MFRLYPNPQLQDTQCTCRWLTSVIVCALLVIQDERERKKQEQFDRKQESKLLLEAEEEKLGGKVKAAKVTRAEISEAEERQRRQDEGAAALPRGVVLGPDIDENPNHLLHERLARGELDARTVAEAIDVLGVSNSHQDTHPEKGLKAAFAAFELRALPRLKAEHPNLRLSQVKQLLRKEWMKSPENPMNNY